MDISIIIFSILAIVIITVVAMAILRSQVPEIKRVPAKANWDGIPKPNLTWKEVFGNIKSSIVPFTLEIPLTHCPTCGSKLLDYRSAFTIHEEGTKGQYDVSGEYCKNGCYTYMSCA